MTLQTVFLMAATMLTGLSAGVILIYGHTIMPGLAKTDDRTFVAAFQALDRAIINPLFMVTFFGSLVCSGVAALAHLSGPRLPWILTATALYLLVVIITMVVHVPLNEAIKAAGDPSYIDVARVRADFREGRWVVWNVWRILASLVAFGCLAWALTR